MTKRDRDASSDRWNESGPTDLRFFSLLYVPTERNDGDSPNLKSSPKRVEIQAKIYLKMAARLARGINRHFHSKLTLATNSPELLSMLKRQLFYSHDSDFDIESIHFPNSFPVGARFQSASQKTALYRHLRNRTGYSIVLDLDMLCLAPFRAEVEECIQRGQPVVYDISEQVIPAYTYSRIERDVGRLTHSEGLPQDFTVRWFGGEFLGGTSSFFADLAGDMETLIPRYLEIWPTLHHQGDEILTTAYLNTLVAAGRADFCDGGASSAVRRHWGIPTKHVEPRLRFDEIISFLHLPAKKGLLTSKINDSLLRRLVDYQVLSSVLSKTFLLAQ